MHETCGWAERRECRISADSELVATMGIVGVPPTTFDAATGILCLDPLIVSAVGRQGQSTDAVQPHKMPFDHLLAINQHR